VRPTTRRLLLLLVCGVAVFAAISVYADVREIGARLAGFAWWALAAALGLALVNYGIRYLRWELYLRARDLKVPRKLSALTFLSGFALSVTPGKVGELVKSYLLRESCRIPIARSAPIVVAERVTDLAALLLLAAIGTAMHGVAGTTVLIGVAILLTGLVALSWPWLARLLIRGVTAPRPMRRFRERLVEFHGGLAELVRPRPLSWATGLGVIAWLAECVGFALIVAAFPGTDVSLGLAILIYAATTVAGALSFLPAGLVVTEAGMTLLLVQLAQGADEPTAVAATILTRLATLWFAVLLGVMALAWLRRVTGAAAAPDA
jgi:glycosyltransferase 2 family protein